MHAYFRGVDWFDEILTDERSAISYIMDYIINPIISLCGLKEQWLIIKALSVNDHASAGWKGTNYNTVGEFSRGRMGVLAIKACQ